MSTPAQALRMLRQEWRSGELRLLLLALSLAVTAVTAVGFFTNRVERAMELQASSMLAADLLLRSHDPIPDGFREQARNQGLRQAEVIEFPSAVVAGEQTQLVEVKAADTAYPLRGTLRTRTALGAAEQPTQELPSEGEVWVEERLLAALNLDTGGNISLGRKSFLITRVLTRDSGEGGNLFRLGPKVLMPLADLPATGLVTPASRVHYQLLVAGERSAIERYSDWAEKHLPKGISLRQMSNARPELSNALHQAQRFLGLAALVAVLVCGAAVALATRRYVRRQSDTSAILRCLGAGSRQLRQLLLWRLLALALVASLIGGVLGYLAQFALTGLIGNWFNSDLPSPSASPLLGGMATALLTLMGFTLVPLLRLSRVPPLRVLRRDLGAPPASTWWQLLAVAGSLLALLIWQAGELRLALILFLATLATLALLLVSGRLLLMLLRHLPGGGTASRQAITSLLRNPGITSLQLAGFGIGVLALLLLTLVRSDLMTSWERTLPEGTPNRFLINIQPHQVEPLKQFLAKAGIDTGGIYPMLRARLVRIGERSVKPEDYPDDRARRLVSREFNLSWSDHQPEQNPLVSGQWWKGSPTDAPQFSVESGIAQTLGIRIGDELEFLLAGTPIRGRVSNLRQVRWESFRPNFFVIGTPGLLSDYPATFITSYYLPPGQERLNVRLLQTFPGLTLIDAQALMEQVREIIRQGASAIEAVFLFTLGAGLLLLYAGIQAGREARCQEAAILRTLGISKSQLLKSLALEFLLLGALAGLLASLAASAAGWWIADELLAIPYRFNPWIPLLGVLGTAMVVALSGVAAGYPLVLRPPLETLRRA